MQYLSVCGGDFLISSDKQILTSPNFPNNYPNQINCTWTIRARRDRTLLVRFVSLDLQPSSPCTKDYVEVFNGAGYVSPSFGRFCTQKPENVFESTSNSLKVYFRSDESISAPGFLVVVEEKRLGCSDDQIVLTYGSPSGELKSPGFPTPYRHSLDCVWVIRSPQGTKIQIDFDRDNFQLERMVNGRCIYDYVELRDGASPLSPLIGRYCDSQAPGTVSSTGSYLFVRFNSDESASFKGFVATYKIAKCGGTIVIGQSGIITSPNYPNPYENHLQCEWLVIAPEGHFINFSFVDVMTIGAYDRNCSRGDFVEIRDFNSTGPSFGRFCYTTFGSTEPKRTSSNRMHVLFKSDSQLSARGFKLSFNVSIESCGGVLSDSTGVITSPNYPRPFPTNRKCTWKITVPQAYAVNLRFEDFHIPETPARHICPYDGVKIFDGPTVDSPLIASLCGPDIPANRSIVSSSNEMAVYFYSDASIVGRGFKATFKADQPARCGGRITQSGQVITVEKSTTGLRSSYCHWIIDSPYDIGNSTIRLSFLSFNLSEGIDCSLERVMIYGDVGPDGSDDVRTLYCGMKNNFSLMYWQNIVHVVYMSPTSTGSFRFAATFFSCGGLRDQETGVITSPNYPQMYEHLTHCQWLLTAPEGVQLKVKLTDINLELEPDCQYDNVTIRNGPYKTSPVVRTWCLPTLPPDLKEITSASRMLLITFHSDVSNAGRGFRLEHQQVTDSCGSIVHGRTGVITSPNYPRPYVGNDMCQWEIVTPIGYHVEIKFVAFDLQRSQNCTKDYLRVEEMHYISSERTSDRANDFPISRWVDLTPPQCGYDTPNFIVSDTEYVRLTFKTDERVSGSGFNLTWIAVCGATYRERSGKIRSPFFPENYENRMSCEYLIVPNMEGTFFIVLVFESFALEKARVGCHDYIEVTEIMTNRMVAKMCGFEPPAPVSTKGQMKILFRTDESRVYRGFLANYAVSACGGNITLFADADRQAYRITSPAFPAKYHNNMNCIWTITAPPDMILSLKFSNLSMESHVTCNYDHVEIRDGDNQNSSLLARLCGKITPTRAFKSSSNLMRIRMYTDNSVVEIGGFVADVTATLGPRAGCGGVLNISSKTTLNSPLNSVGGRYYAHMHCEWQVQAPANMVIRVNVKSFHLEAPGGEGCYDYLEIHDGFFEAGPLIGSYCDTLQPWEFVSSTNQLYFVFVTDLSGEMPGFQLELEPIAAVCGGRLTATDKPQSLSYQASRQRFNLRCQWRIQADSTDARIKIDVASIQYPDEDGVCSGSYIEFTDIPKTALSQSATACGSSSPPFTSETSAVLITSIFESNLNLVPTFNLTYKKFTSCNQTIELRQGDGGGRLTSPNYPNSYGHNVRCLTQLVAPIGFKIFLYFNDFRLEPPRRGNCSYDYVLIEERNIVSRPKYCGSMLPPSYESTSNAVNVTFKSDPSVTAPGYDLTYSFSNSRCGGTINAQSGAITSPGYPDRYPENVRCVWTLRVNRGRAINVKITNLALSTRNDIPCSPSADMLAVIIGESMDWSQLVNTYCTTDALPVDLWFRTNAVTIVFNSDFRTGNGNGFRLKFQEAALPSPAS